MAIEVTNWKQEWGEWVNIAANSGIQFLDFRFESSQLKQFRTEFGEKYVEDERVELFRIEENDEIQFEGISYEITEREVFAAYLDEWIPIPFFSKDRISNSGGPFNWARARIKHDKDYGEDRYLVQIAIDTTIGDAGADAGYLQPSKNDADVEREFIFSSDFKAAIALIMDGFVDESSYNVDIRGKAWVADWLHYLFEKFLASNLRNEKLEDESKFEPWAYYIAFLELLNNAISVPTLKIGHSLYSKNDVVSIDVDLILDVGNSRTCGLLLEAQAGATKLNFQHVTQVCLRDLNAPENEYTGLFQSRVEFADQNFGHDKFSRISGRNNAFLWPSWVRFGPEAARLIANDRGNEEFSGLSSPKRYLWDNSTVDAQWRFHNWSDSKRLPKSLAASMPDLTRTGDCRDQITAEINDKLRDKKTDKTDAIHPVFSKSSLYGFMIMELIAQAFRQINDPKYKGAKEKRATPRNLRNIIITLPTATPSQEHAIVKSKVRGAIKLLWKRMVKTGQVSGSTEPNIRVDWDEATCSQVMFLYGEIIEKFNGRTSEFLKIYGQERQQNTDDNNKKVNSLKLACVDVGGGTTDLMVTTFYQHNDISLHPEQEFREGFRKAGDDVLCLIIENIILPKLKLSMKRDNNDNVIDAIFMNLFGKSVAGKTTTDRHKQRQFSIKFLAPLALEIFNTYFGLETEKTIKISDCNFANNLNDVSDYLEIPIEQTFSTSGKSKKWVLKDQELTFYFSELENIIELNFKYIFENISEVLRNLDVDFILLTGRPTTNTKVVNLFKACCALPPNRVLALSEYKTGSWYPFRDPEGRVGDPKSSVSVGAMLIASAGAGRINDFHINANKFTMAQTDKYIGKIENNGQIRTKDTYFDSRNNNDEHDTKIITDTFLGSRQLTIERWTANPLYKINFKEFDGGEVPYEIKLRDQNKFNLLNGIPINPETLKCPISLIQVLSASGRNKKNDLEIKLQTLGVEDEYWLDSGAFTV